MLLPLSQIKISCLNYIYTVKCVQIHVYLDKFETTNWEQKEYFICLYDLIGWYVISQYVLCCIFMPLYFQPSISINY
jgi:hypothetical protein